MKNLLKNEHETKAVVLFSGGQDSTTVLAHAIDTYGADNIYPVTALYGQRHNVEVQQAYKIADALHCREPVLLSTDVLTVLGGSALVGKGEVDAPHSYNDNLPASFVPNRNAFFLTLAHSYAQKVGAHRVYAGMCQTDYSGYPDCRAVFVQAMAMALNLGAARPVEFVTPLMYLSKAQTFMFAENLGVLQLVIDSSHTCYNGVRSSGGDWGRGCGMCPACLLRINGYDEFIKEKGETDGK